MSKREAASLVATDADVAVTIQMLPGARRAPGTVLVHDGRDPWAEVVVRAESLGLLELAATPLRFDLPDVMTADGRAMVWQLVRGRIRRRRDAAAPRHGPPSLDVPFGAIAMVASPDTLRDHKRRNAGGSPLSSSPCC